MLTTVLTKGDVVGRVRLLMKEDQLTPDTAARVVIHDILRSAEDTDQLLGIVVPYLARAATSKKRKRNRSRPNAELARKGSWLNVLADHPEELWRLLVPVPGTSVTKRLGDFTIEDVRRVERYYRIEARRMELTAERWHEIHRKMKPGDTLEQAAIDGRISKAQILAIGQDLDEDAEEA